MRLIAAFLMFAFGTSCATTEGLQPTGAELGGVVGVTDPQDWADYEGCIAAGYSPIEWPAGTGQWACACPDHTTEDPHVLIMWPSGTDPIIFRDLVIEFCNMEPEPGPGPSDPGLTAD
jgi:hypothetical protein